MTTLLLVLALSAAAAPAPAPAASDPPADPADRAAECRRLHPSVEAMLKGQLYFIKDPKKAVAVVDGAAAHIACSSALRKGGPGCKSLDRLGQAYGAKLPRNPGDYAADCEQSGSYLRMYEELTSAKPDQTDYPECTRYFASGGKFNTAARWELAGMPMPGGEAAAKPGDKKHYLDFSQTGGTKTLPGYSLPYDSFPSTETLYAQYASYGDSADPYAAALFTTPASTGDVTAPDPEFLGMEGLWGTKNGQWDGGFWTVCHGMAQAVQTRKVDMCAQADAMSPFLTERMPADQWARNCRGYSGMIVTGDDSGCAEISESPDRCRMTAALTRAYQAHDPARCPPGAAGGVCRAHMLKTEEAACRPLLAKLQDDYCEQWIEKMKPGPGGSKPAAPAKKKPAGP